MKKCILLLVLFSSILACTRHHPSDDSKKETPAALQDNKSEVSSYLPSKRMNYDLVDELYLGLVSENPALKDIENLMNDNNTQKEEILEKYRAFDSKNDSYYYAANSQMEAISDSVLKAKLLSIIKASSDKYNGKANYLKAIIKHIEVKSVSIRDYHTTMKVVLTMPLIENFQRNHLPKDSIYKGFYKQQDQLIGKMDNMIKK